MYKHVVRLKSSEDASYPNSHTLTIISTKSTALELSDFSALSNGDYILSLVSSPMSGKDIIGFTGNFYNGLECFIVDSNNSNAITTTTLYIYNDTVTAL